MAFKFILFFSLFVLTVASPQHHQTYRNFQSESNQLLPYHATKTQHKGPAEYDFVYSVHDDHTKDIKSQTESRRGDIVKGHYDMIDSDGYKRIVDYTADDKSGFQALVHREKSNIVVPIPVSTEYKHSYHHGVNDGSHLIPHQLHLPVPYVSAHKSAESYTIAKKPIVTSKYVTPVVKYAPKYVVPIVHKNYVTEKVPVSHYVTKSDHPADTHVSFHGVNANYEY